jgi:ribosomal protein S18 acetylase RimI-like enzyme
MEGSVTASDGARAARRRPGEAYLRIVVRRAAERDVAGILDVWDSLMAHHERLDPSFERCGDAAARFESYLRGNMSDPDWLVLVAAEGASVVGFAMAQATSRPPVFRLARCCHIDSLAVAPSHRRRGVGTRLARRVLTWAEGRGLGRVELRVASANEAGRAFWEGLGFGEEMRLLRLERPRRGRGRPAKGAGPAVCPPPL